ncbi:MAG: alkaline phosphatase family protein [Lachnospiraceae bacterium]|nr:alkaline phosphatase family protein [Lachnospiraceae bacterium]
MKQPKIVVVSMDALFYEDLEYLKCQPVFGAFLKKAAIVERVKSIYPTLTYPCHATMTTGCWPAKHGVLNNKKFMPGVAKPDWNWYHEAYRAPDLLDRAKEAGLMTAVVGWPTMGRHPHADWIVAEIAGTSAQTAEEFRRDYLLTGTTEELWDTLCADAIYYRAEQKQVAYFNAKCAAELIRRYQPDLLLVHLAEPDHMRHAAGIQGDGVLRALDDCEAQLAMILEGVRESGAEDCYNLVVTADHGQMNIIRTAKPNVLFVENGFAELDEAGKLKSWRAWAHTMGMSSMIRVKDPADEAAVFALLSAHCGEGFSKVYTREEAAAFGLDGDFSFVLETDDLTRFKDSFTGAYLEEEDHIKGSHGYHPDKASRPPIVAVGPSFKTGAVVPDARLIDGAPTWAKVLGITLPDADGAAVEGILN